MHPPTPPPPRHPRAGHLPPVDQGSRFNSPDTTYDAARLPAGSGVEKRAFTYFVLGGARFLYASAARLAVIHAVSTMSASADVLALASVEVDLSSVALGQTITVKWRGKPVFIKHRSPEQIAELAAPVSDLRHVQTDAERVQRPEWLIVIGVCTHLGCVPMPNAGDYAGWVSVCVCVCVCVCGGGAGGRRGGLDLTVSRGEGRQRCFAAN